MKRCIIILLLTLIVHLAFAPTNKVFYIYVDKGINLLEINKLKILKAIIKVERPRTKLQALQAKIREDAVGILQIRPIGLQEANRIVGYNKYSLEDREDSTKSVEMFYIIQNYWNPKYNFKKAAFIWNAGSDYMHSSQNTWMKLKIYWKKVDKNIK